MKILERKRKWQPFVAFWRGKASWEGRISSLLFEICLAERLKLQPLSEEWEKTLPKQFNTIAKVKAKATHVLEASKSITQPNTTSKRNRSYSILHGLCAEEVFSVAPGKFQTSYQPATFLPHHGDSSIHDWAIGSQTSHKRFKKKTPPLGTTGFSLSFAVTNRVF